MDLSDILGFEVKDLTGFKTGEEFVFQTCLQMSKIKDFKIVPNTELENEVYHSMEGLSSSTIAISETSTHYKNYLKQDGERKKAFDLGTVFHAYVLEPDTVHWVNDSELVKNAEVAFFLANNKATKSPRATKAYKDLVSKVDKNSKAMIN